MSGNSLRGVEKNGKLEGKKLEKNHPSFSSIRDWVGKVGLGEVRREKEKRDDWLLIIDLSAELGKEKCLVILGVSQEYYLQEVVANQRGLKHQDVEVLGLAIMSSTKGELIAEELEKVTQKVGRPRQIVSDQGSDLYKGIKIYQEKNPEVIHTYDVTHQMAWLLKQELQADKKHQSFLKKCYQCRKEIQQTELLFLRPPEPRSKSRYCNLDSLIHWGNKILMYEKKKESITERFLEKLGWLKEYKESLINWKKMLEITRCLETNLKKQGLNQQSLGEWEEWLSITLIPLNLSDFVQKIRNYLVKQTAVIQEETSFLATSDILESLFGKYKFFSQRSPVKELGRMILTIPLATLNLIVDLIKQSLETTTSLDVKNWENQMFGQSTLSKRKKVFSAQEN